MNLISVDSMINISSYLSLSEYNKIDTLFNKIAKDKAARIITKYMKKWFNRCIVVETEMYKIVEQYFLHREEYNLIDSNPVYEFYCKTLPITNRNCVSVENLVKKHSKYVSDYIFEYINISKIRVEFEMSEVYELNSEMIALQRKLNIIRLEMQRDTDINNMEIDIIFIEKIIKDNYSIESAMFYVENLIFLKTIEYLSEKKLRLNSFCDEYIIYCLLRESMDNIANTLFDKLILMSKDKLSNIGIDFNKIIYTIEPEVLIEYFSYIK